MSGSLPRVASTKASSDCRKCKSRRIICDRALPKCRKCGTRSLECPGYGSQWKWVEGTAKKAKRKQQPSRDLTVHLGYQIQPDLTSGLDETVGSGGSRTLQNICTTLGPNGDASRQLLHHYTRVVAPQMVWVDSAHNPFVTVIIPRALQSPALMMSILAVAAGDMWTRKHELLDGPSNLMHLWKPCQQQALDHLSQYLKDENNQEIITANHDRDRASPGLAAFLLASLGLKLGSSTAWRMHTRAAWTMTEHWNFVQSSHSSPVDDVKAFLLSEVYANEVWESITNFRPLESYPELTSALHGMPFFQYIELIRSISSYERCKTNGNTDMNPGPSLMALRSAFDEARKRTRNSLASMTYSSPSGYAGFESVVYLLHHAGILYACQVLPEDEHAEEFARVSRDRLFEHFQQLTITETIAQDLTWPLFIAGTQCFRCYRKQQLIESNFFSIMKLSGILERPRVLQFLKELWSLQAQEQDTNWIDLARMWARDGKPILII
jgi:hypothetical protein